jgi:hypothetical protein
MNDDIIDRLRVTIPTEASQQAYLTFEQKTMLEAAEEIKRLRGIIRNFIKAEQDMQNASYDYFAVDYDEDMAKAIDDWKDSYSAMEEEANRDY